MIAYLVSTSNVASELRIDDICAALGYDAAKVPKSIEQIHEVHPATTASTCVEFIFIGQDAFQGKQKSPALNVHSHCVQGK